MQSAYVVVIILLIRTQGFLLLWKISGICARTRRHACVCGCLSGSGPLCSASFQAWASCCTVLLDLCECPTACSGHCATAQLPSQAHGAAGQQRAQLLPPRPDQNQTTLLFFLLTDNCKIKPAALVTMIDTVTQEISHRFLQNSLWPLKCDRLPKLEISI